MGLRWTIFIRRIPLPSKSSCTLEGVGRSAASAKDAEGEDNVNGALLFKEGARKIYHSQLAERKKFIFIASLPNLRYNAYVCGAR